MLVNLMLTGRTDNVSGLGGYGSNADILPVIIPDGFVDIFDVAWVNWNWEGA
jgi:hypothetical protein